MRESEERYTKWKERKDEEIKVSKEKGCREVISPTRGNVNLFGKILLLFTA